MNAVALSDAQSNLIAELIEKVRDDHEPLLINLPDAKPVVIMSLEDFESYDTTAYLLRNPKGAERLLRSITEIEAGGGTEHELIECD